MALALAISRSGAQDNGEPHRLVTKKIPTLHKEYKVDVPPCSEADEFISMLRLFAQKYSIRDIVEEYYMVGMWPIRGAWEIPDSD